MLKKYVITGDIVEVYSYSRYMKGTGRFTQNNRKINRYRICFKKLC